MSKAHRKTGAEHTQVMGATLEICIFFRSVLLGYLYENITQDIFLSLTINKVGFHDKKHVFYEVFLDMA